jgi:hypothetical protein
VQFSHNETVNSGPCPAGSVTECDDVVTITTPILSALITSGTDSYLFKLLGFSKDGKTFSSVYMSPEGGDNAAQLYAEVTPAPVPEPGSLVLLGSGLMGLAAAARRRNRRKA